MGVLMIATAFVVSPSSADATAILDGNMNTRSMASDKVAYLNYVEEKASFKVVNSSFSSVSTFIMPVRLDDISWGHRDVGMHFHPVYNVWRFHNGDDLGEPKDTPLYAVMDGEITEAFFNVTADETGANGGAGNYVTIKNGDVYVTYMHLNYGKYANLVSVGDIVNQGDMIAAVGDTGTSTGAHLHIRVQVITSTGETRYYEPKEVFTNDIPIESMNYKLYGSDNVYNSAGQMIGTETCSTCGG